MRTNKILLSSLVVASLLVGIPYLFLVTKDSFLSPLSPTDKLLVFLLSLLICFALIFLLSLLLASIDLLVLPQRKPLLVSIFFAFTSAVVLLNFFDTFLYVLFGYGLVKALGFDRAIWLVAFIGMVLFLTRDFGKLFKAPAKIERQANSYQLNGFQRVLIGLAAGLILIYPMSSIISLKPSKELVGGKEFPNIVLVTVDGLNASRLSGFGYHRYTTPFLDGLIKKGITNAFHYTNAANTTGSITSILTGKLPTTTRVIYPPDILRGKDRFEHLPAILNNSGFYTAQFGVKTYVDANDVNFLDGFDEVNGRQGLMSTAIDRFFPELASEYSFFLLWLMDHYSQRTSHVFFLSTMEDQMETVSGSNAIFLQDSQKFDSTIDLIRNSEKPVFSHIHIMGTHGPFFYPASRLFSAWKDISLQSEWDGDLYDDAIVDLDNQIRSFVSELAQDTPAEKLLLILTSDHGQNYNVRVRIPLIIYDSDVTVPITLHSETQNLDIPPTILRIIGLEVPGWMKGKNLLLKEDTDQYPIFSTAATHVIMMEDGQWLLDSKKINEPFYQFGYFQVLHNSKWLEFDLMSGVSDHGYLSNPVLSVDSDLSSDEYLAALIFDQLRADGFNFKLNFFKD